MRSFVRREGRITAAQARALSALSDRYGVPISDSPLNLPGLFGRLAPCHLEIGCGNGDCLLALARAHPENNYLGIEVHRPGIGSMFLRAARDDLRNLRVLNRDALEALPYQIPVASMECIYLFFPDPWPKKRHHKRRVVQPEFVWALWQRLSAHGRLFIGTDSEDYAGHIAAVMEDCPGFANLAAPARWAPRPAWRPLTRYERHALRSGRAIRDLAYGCIEPGLRQ